MSQTTVKREEACSLIYRTLPEKKFEILKKKEKNMKKTVRDLPATDKSKFQKEIEEYALLMKREIN